MCSKAQKFIQQNPKSPLINNSQRKHTQSHQLMDSLPERESNAVDVVVFGKLK